MWTESNSPAFLVLIAASIAAHIAFVAFAPKADATPTPPQPPTFFTMTEPAPPPPPPPAPPEVEPIETAAARAPAPRATTRATPRRAARPPQVATAEPPPGPEAPVDFSGVTLSNEGASWSSPTGNGEAITGPIAVSEPSTRPTSARGARNGSGTDRVVAVGDLSRPPKAPDLDDALVANYPREARRAGTTGKALVRARILADGTVGTIRIISESGTGFGEACKRTLAGSRWQPPLDAQQKPVITDISYTCTFAVAR